MRSLQTRLLLGVVAALIVLLAVFSTSVYWGFHRTLFAQFDGVLAAMADILSVSVEMDANEVDVELEVQRMAEFNNPDLPMNYQIWHMDGTPMARSPLLGDSDLPRPSHLNPEEGPRFLTLKDNRFRPIRVVCLVVRPKVENSHEGEESSEPKYFMASERSDLVLVVARDLSGLYTQLDTLSRLLMGVALGTVVLSVCIGFVIVRQGLKPLKTIAGQIAEIGEHDLSVRIQGTPVPAEIEPIQMRLNDLLDRLDTAFQRERRFTADAAHELRTPLAGLRSILEVCLAQPRDAVAYREALCDGLSVSCEMQVMVENLLTLARLEGRDILLNQESIALSDLVNICWRPLSDKALEKRLQFDNEVDSSLTCVSDPTYLAMIFTNCLDNAVTYTDIGGKIRVGASVQTLHAQVIFTNTGCTLTQEELIQCFDPFWRADVSRSASGNHCGLGLALVKRIALVLGGEVSASVSPQHEFSLTLHLQSDSQ